LPERQRKIVGKIIWINCLMHATVHGIDGMMDMLNAKLLQMLGAEKMAELRGLQTGTSAKSEGERPRAPPNPARALARDLLSRGRLGSRLAPRAQTPRGKRTT
jgi:hypothetical protein